MHLQLEREGGVDDIPDWSRPSVLADSIAIDRTHECRELLDQRDREVAGARRTFGQRFEVEQLDAAL